MRVELSANRPYFAQPTEIHPGVKHVHVNTLACPAKSVALTMDIERGFACQCCLLPMLKDLDWLDWLGRQHSRPFGFVIGGCSSSGGRRLESTEKDRGIARTLKSHKTLSLIW